MDLLVHRPLHLSTYDADIGDMNLSRERRGNGVAEAKLRRDERDGMLGADGRAQRLTTVGVEAGWDIDRQHPRALVAHEVAEVGDRQVKNAVAVEVANRDLRWSGIGRNGRWRLKKSVEAVTMSYPESPAIILASIVSSES